jgi:hypothetical protein
MTLHRAIQLFESHDGFRQFKKTLSPTAPLPVDSRFLRDRALKLAELHEPKGDWNELNWALSEFSVFSDDKNFQQISAMLAFIAKTVFRDVSRSLSQETAQRILEFKGPRYLFVGHTSYFDYILASQLADRIGIPAPIVHVTGSLTKGWVSNWLTGFRYLSIPKNMSPLQHRAYAWFSAALA